MSYLLQSPTYISLFCEIPPEPGCGGEAVLVANREFQREINPEVKDKFKRLGIRHTHVYPSRTKDTYLSWQEVLEVDDRESAERVMINKGFSYQWHPDGSIAYWYHLPATRPHHSTGEEIWFNQVQSNASYFRSHPRWMDADIPDHMMPFHTYYGDGSAVDPNVIRHIRSVEWKHAVGMQPQKGDLLFLDNMLVQHGRLGYVGKRRLLVTLMSGL
ncbi:dapdiamide synthesis protein DdaC-like [Liolophura sinensis]|uniref:dapdiamide synthesis protein DdaC-like n=1 Tax=Liolophura sinensis TaxID=3198878 RepID=UPI003158AF0B